MQIRVYYEDTDLGGIVYHSNYLKFCERARSELFFQNSLLPYSDSGHFIVKSLNAEFKKPALFGDILEVKTEVLEKKIVSLKLLQTVLKDGEIYFRMEIVLVFIHNNKMSKIPLEFMRIFNDITI